MTSAAGRIAAALSSPRIVGVPLLGDTLDRVAGAALTPDSLREPLARNLASSWSARSEPQRAEQVLRSAARCAKDPSTAALLEASAVSRALDRHVPVPDEQVHAAVVRCLERADLLLSAGDDRITRLLTAGAALTFHRQRHLAGLGSPFSTPGGVTAELAPYRASAAWGQLTSPRVPAPQPRNAFTAVPGSLVVLHDDDPRFIEAAVARWRQAGIDVRVVGLRAAAADAGVRLPSRLGELVEARWNGVPASDPVTDLLHSLTAGADVVWQEWAQRAAVVTSLVPGLPSVIVRAHSFELFTALPHLVDRGALAGVVAVSEPLARLARTVVSGWNDLPWALMAPEFDSSRFVLPKHPDAPRTLGVVGWAAPDKDVRWALDLLATLRATDAAWRLRLIGSPPDPSRWPEHATAVSDRLDRPDVRDAVDIVGPSDDVAGQLRHVGVGLSSSVRESYHLGLAEMAASGALPVVRDWPVLSAYGGAAAVWPADWVVQSVADAADRILSQPVPAAGWQPSPVEFARPWSQERSHGSR